MYLQAKADKRIGEVRALIRNVTNAREVLKCDKCDASEGIFLGDVTNTTTLLPAALGADSLAIAVGTGQGASEGHTRTKHTHARTHSSVHTHANQDLMKAVEWKGVINSVTGVHNIYKYKPVTNSNHIALAQPANLQKFGLANLRVAFVSSFGTTTPNPPVGASFIVYCCRYQLHIAATGLQSFTLVWLLSD